MTTWCICARPGAARVRRAAMAPGTAGPGSSSGCPAHDRNEVSDDGGRLCLRSKLWTSPTEGKVFVRGFRHLSIGVAVTSLLSLAAVAASTGIASAGTIGSCGHSGVLATCAVSGVASDPLAFTATVRSKPRGGADISWSITCERGTSQKSSSGSFTKKTPYTHTIPHPFRQPDECDIVVTAGLGSGSGRIHLFVASASALAIKGFGGKCVNDAHNSSAAGTKIQIWTCNRSAAQNWAFNKGELMHNGKCVSDKRSGGRGSKVILSPCKHSPNEIWTHNSRREYVLKAHGGKLCLDDPRSSKKNGTQLIVNTCKNRANQHWSLP